MRILFLVHCRSFSPSTQRRVLDYLPFLKEEGIKWRIVDYFNGYLYRKAMTFALNGRGRAVRLFNSTYRLFFLALVLVTTFVAMLRIFAVCRHFNVVFIQKVLLPGWFLATLKRRNPNIVFDIDDAVFLRRPGRTRAALRASVLVLAGSHYNLDYALRINSHVSLLPTPVPAERYVPRDYESSGPPGAGDSVVVGWIGSPSTLADLDTITPVIDLLSQKNPNLKFRLIGFGNRLDLVPKYRYAGCELIPRVPYEQVPHEVRQFDIGIMPLQEREWSRGKCVGKALEYMAAGVPAVVSDFGENPYAISNGENGLLAATNEQWSETISLLASDAALRRKIGLAGRTTVEDRYATNRCAEALVDKIRGLSCL